jgi:DNA polymerase III alpha subunit
MSTSSAAKPQFTHLHLHSEYSLLDGANRIGPLLKRVADLGMKSVALTDHGNLFGIAEFFLAANKAGIKPILGIEAYVAPEKRGMRAKSKIGPDGGFHLVLLAQTNEGWGNLVKLSSDAYLNGFYHKPRMDHESLAQWSTGLIESMDTWVHRSPSIFGSLNRVGMKNTGMPRSKKQSGMPKCLGQIRMVNRASTLSCNVLTSKIKRP